MKKIILLIAVILLTLAGGKSRVDMTRFNWAEAVRNAVQDDDWEILGGERVAALQRGDLIPALIDTLKAIYGDAAGPQTIEKLVADFYNGLGMALVNEGLNGAALVYFTRACSVCVKYDFPEGIRANLINQALTSFWNGDTTRALGFLKNVLDLHFATRDYFDYTADELRVLIWNFGETDTVLDKLEAAYAKNGGPPTGWLFLRAYINYKDENYEGAMEYFTRVRDRYRQAGDRTGEYFTGLFLGGSRSAQQLPPAEVNEAFFNSLLVTLEDDTIANADDVLSDWFQNSYGGEDTASFVEDVFGILSQVIRSSPSKGRLRAKLDYIWAAGTVFDFDVDRRVSLLKDALTVSHRRDDTLYTILIPAALAELYFNAGKTDSAFVYFRPALKAVLKNGDWSALSGIVKLIGQEAMMDDPFRGLKGGDWVAAVAVNNYLKVTIFDIEITAVALDSLRICLRRAKTGQQARIDYYIAEAFHGLGGYPDSAEYYYWQAYSRARAGRDTILAFQVLASLGFESYDPFQYLKDFERGLDDPGLTPDQAARFRLSNADGLKRLADNSYYDAAENWQLCYEMLDPLRDPQSGNLILYRDLIDYFTGAADEPPSDPPPIADLAGIGRDWPAVLNRPDIDSLNEYLEDAVKTNEEWGTDTWVPAYFRELKGAGAFAWAGRLKHHADAYYRRAADIFEGALGLADCQADPQRGFNLLWSMIQAGKPVREYGRLVTAYDLLLDRCANQVYRRVDSFTRQAINDALMSITVSITPDRKYLFKYDLLAFGNRTLEFQGLGGGWGGKMEERIGKPEVEFPALPGQVKFIRPVRYNYIEVRTPTWGADRVRNMPERISAFKKIYDGDPAIRGRWEMLEALLRIEAEDLRAADSLLTSVPLADSSDTWLAAAVRLARGNARQALGDYGKALIDYRTAAGSAKKIDENDYLMANLNGNLGNLSFTTGDWKTARVFYDSVGQTVEGFPTWPLIQARARISQGNLRLITALNDGNGSGLDTAFQLYRDAQRLMGNNIELTLYLTAALNMGICARQLGDDRAADSLIDATQREARRSDLRGLEAASAAVAAIFRSDEGKTAEALEACDRSIRIFRSVQDRLSLSNALALRGRILRKADRARDARAALGESIEIFETLRAGFGDGDAGVSFNTLGADRYAEMVQLLLGQDSVSSALEYLERSKSARLKEVFSGLALETGDPKLDDDLSRLRGIALEDERLESRIREENSRSGDRTGPTAVKDLGEVRARNRAELEEILVDLELNNPDIYSLLAIKPQLFAEDRIRQSIPEGAVFLEYFPADTALYIFLFTRETLAVHTVPASRSRIDSLVAGFRSLIAQCAQSIAGGFEIAPIDDWQDDGSARYRDDIKPVKDLLAELYGCLIGPVEKEIESSEIAVIIPSGSLYYLPFHALAREENGRFTFLIEKVKISYLSSSTMMDALSRRDVKFDNLLAFGDPDGSLKGAREEVKAIAEIVPNTEVFTLGEATESRVKIRPDSFTVLHLATHAILNNANPKSSYIVFAPDTAKGEDGKLGFGEILRIPLKKKTILVTLSACQTAVGKNPTGSEVINLTRAFTSAGVPSILSTLWPVEDMSTRNLMIAFYQNLTRENKVESLRNAQLKLLKTSATAHPFFWAPFVLIGDWQ